MTPSQVTLSVNGAEVSLVDFIQKNVVETQNITTDELISVLELSPYSFDTAYVGNQIVKNIKIKQK